MATTSSKLLLVAKMKALIQRLCKRVVISQSRAGNVRSQLANVLVDVWRDSAHGVDTAQQEPGLQPERDGRVRWSAWFFGASRFIACRATPRRGLRPGLRHSSRRLSYPAIPSGLVD